jgi:hypothetical protein
MDHAMGKKKPHCPMIRKNRSRSTKQKVYAFCKPSLATFAFSILL